MDKPKVNHEGWLRNALLFIRTKGLETEFIDWSGGWRCHVFDELDLPKSLFQRPAPEIAETEDG